VQLEVQRAEPAHGGADEGKAALEFKVLDTGPGLPPAAIDRLFTLFMRLDSGAEFRREGTGVGLALVRRLCHLMGGSVTAANRPGGGSVFTVRLSFPSTNVVAAPPVALARPASRVLKVLVAEDNTAARELLVEAIQLQGHEVVGMADGPSALAACERGEFDTLVADVNLPGFDGIELTRRLRRDGRRLRIVGCSAEAFASMRDAALAAGMDAFLTKPVSLAALADALPVSPPPDQSVFAYLHTPAAVEKTRRMLAAEWPRLRSEAQAGLDCGDTATLVRVAHYVESSALLADDAQLLDGCRRLSRAARVRGENDACLAALDAMEKRIVPERIPTAT
jgi:CheY-like chemotaxis protein